MLSISHLRAGYQNLPVLKDITLSVEQGSIGVLMGPNGAGKSTLLKAIFNLVRITRGTIIFQGQPIIGLPTHQLLTRSIGFIPQGKINFGSLTVEENLRLGAYHHRHAHPIDQQLERSFKEFPVLQERRRTLAFQLSGGQQQMLAIARAFMNTPKLLLLDEPSLGLSPKLVQQLFAKLKHLNQQHGTTILIVEHNLKSALDIADHGYVLVNGKLMADDTAAQLKKSDILRQVFIGTFE